MQKKKSGVKKGLEIMTIRGGGGGGVRCLMEKTILNFHFDYLNPPLKFSECAKFRSPYENRLSDVEFVDFFTQARLPIF